MASKTSRKKTIYWVLKNEAGRLAGFAMYRMYSDSSHGYTSRKHAVRFKSAKAARTARDGGCCPEGWRVFRVTVRTKKE